MPRIITPPQPSQSQRIAATPHIILKGMVQQWTQAFVSLWGRKAIVPPNASDEVKQRLAAYEVERKENSKNILAELGSEAGPIMQDSVELVEFFLPRLPEAERNQILALIATKPPTTVHEDGTVTIDEE